MPLGATSLRNDHHVSVLVKGVVVLEGEPGGIRASDENVLVVIHARSLPEDVGMEEAAPHPARANPLESLAVPVPVRYDVAHLGVYCVCLAPDGERDASTRWTRLVHRELPEQELQRLRPPCVDIFHLRGPAIISIARISMIHNIICVFITFFNFYVYISDYY